MPAEETNQLKCDESERFGLSKKVINQKAFNGRRTICFSCER